LRQPKRKKIAGTVKIISNGTVERMNPFSDPLLAAMINPADE
jgi:acylphosphatase